MPWYYRGWAPYVPVAERRRQATRAVEALRQTGQPIAPVAIAGRAIATTFWGRAWCDNMESYHDYASRLPRGRTYVRNGAVLDLRIERGRITALVSGSEVYRVTVVVREARRAQWRAICADCAGGVDSLIELLQGRFSQAVMRRLCRQGGGLFPQPSEIRFSCTCPDHALMCKHVAAALYGVGARLDHTPELLFRLRAVDEAELLRSAGTSLPLSNGGVPADKVLPAEDVAALFGLDVAETAAPAPPRDKSSRPSVSSRHRLAEKRGSAAASRSKKATNRTRKLSRKAAVRKKPAATQTAVAARAGPAARKKNATARSDRPRRNAKTRRPDRPEE